MKASELIKALQELIAKHGDLRIGRVDNEYGDSPIDCACYKKAERDAGPFWNDSEELGEFFFELE